MALEAALAVFVPREPIRTLEWALQYATDDRGRPYDDFAYPHLGAPGGPLDALDCRQYLELWLQWGTRLGKSFTGQVGTMKTADCEPCLMMYVGPDIALAKRVFKRTRRMIAHCAALAGQLTRNRDEIELEMCRVQLGWPRSAATLADSDLRFGHAGEIDKWEHTSTSTEADPLKLFDERFKNYAFAHKKVKESSPAERHTSRIERGRLAGTNAQYQVPCQRCGRYQVLVEEQLRFDLPASGRPDKELARATARYECLHCHKENHDEDRGPMMRAGVWVPEGCTVHDKRARAASLKAREKGLPLWRGFSEDADWLIGKPLRDGRHYSSQLSSFYALALSWGDIAAEKVDSELHPENRRNWINGWKAETYEHARRSQTWEQLGERLLEPLDVARGIVPAGFSLLVTGIDKQEDHYAFVSDAWGTSRTSHTLDYGEADDDDELLEILTESYRGQDGKTYKIGLALIDTGFRPKDVYDLVDRAKKRGILLLPCRGSTKSLGPGVTHAKKRLGKDTTRPGAPYVLIDTITTQDWIDRQLHDIPPGGPGGATLFRASLAEHQDFLRQLLNEAPIPRKGADRQVRESWNRLDELIPNDYRDCRRMSFVAMLLRTRGKEIRSQEPGARSRGTATRKPAETPKPPSTPRLPQRRPPPLRRPGGWLNMP